MANNDKETTGVSQETGSEAPVTWQDSGAVVIPPATSAPANLANPTANTSVPLPTTNTPQSRPTLIPLGSAAIAAPHPKKFSAVNINKKFLSSASGPASTNNANSSKSGSTTARPSIQPAASHSRLVTTKLTAAPQPSTPGPGWSRPSSAAPQSSPSTAANGVSLAHGPQLKVIHPHPRGITSPGPTQKDSSSKAVWGNPRGGSASQRQGITVNNDFPTAAEVAQVETSMRQAKLVDTQEAAETAAATKQARAEEADTFRGVHLDPNAHHWDEMEEDDDNFLDGVIEFGDGRQYTVESADQIPLLAATAQSTTQPLVTDHVAPPTPTVPNAVVSKEERFADDFDRSWPRSKTSPTLSTKDITPAVPVPPSPVTSQHTLHSPQESSRVLFNERSNRLEPYSNVAHRPGQNSLASGKHVPLPTEPRSARDIPSLSSSNIQLLQKSGSSSSTTSEFPTRPQGFSGASYNGGVGNDRRESFRRDPVSSAVPVIPRIANAFNSTESGLGDRGRRITNMGPPPLPLHPLRGSSRDNGRQLPPHLSQSPTTPMSMPRRGPSRDARPSSAAWASASEHQAVARPHVAQSPVLSHTSAASVSNSPVLSTGVVASPSIPVVPDEVRKDLMLSAAARAKQRRQQEEEQREKEKERARKKAAELEAKFKALEAEKAGLREAEEKITAAQHAQVIAVIEDAVKSVVDSTPSEPLPHSDKPHMRGTRGLPRPPIEIPRPPFPRRTSTSASHPGIPPSPSVPITPAAHAESWRSKTNPLPTPSPTKPAHRAFVPSSAPTPADVLAENSGEPLEVIDFTELGKFVGAPEEPEPEPEVAETVKEEVVVPTAGTARSQRPVASDFFDDRPPRAPETIVPSKSDVVTWRRTGTRDSAIAPLSNAVVDESTKTRNAGLSVSVLSEKPPTPIHVSTPKTPTAQSHSEEHTDTTPVQILVAPSSVNSQQRTPRTQSFYKEATMTALNDTMSRIKGAIDGMQTGETIGRNTSGRALDHPFSPSRPYLPGGPSPSRPPRDRWMTPALRAAQNYEFDTQPQENVTGFEPPRSPKPAWSTFAIRLPSTSTSVSLEPLNKKQLHLFNTPPSPARWDILSFVPPVEGMNRRDMNLNEVLFPKQSSFKGKRKNKISLPKRYSTTETVEPTDSDKWREDVSGTSLKSDPTPIPSLGLETTSRSPPPTDSSNPLSHQNGDDEIPPLPRSRSQPKMPAGSAVAFYRDSRVEVEVEVNTPVKFIVSSELEQEDAKQDGQDSNSPTVVSMDTPVTNNVVAESSTSRSTEQSFSLPMLVESKAESKSSDDSADRSLVTPPLLQGGSSAWTKSPLSFPVKESPARGPDPEHLKAVWSQPTDKGRMPSVNSLEGIADDLTAIPFTLQDVKSEDGETPPPTSATMSSVPSRMSLHEVTRAFQQVPSSSSSSPNLHRNGPNPASPANASSRPTPYNYANMRSGFAPYPSTPSPTMVYPHSHPHPHPHPHPHASPVPSRMAVAGPPPPMYGQHVWMPLPGPANPNHGGVMRPIGSPYPPQMMPYPQGNMYNPNTPSQHNINGGNRGRPVSMMMSPVMPHAHATNHPNGASMYPGSPVLMHAPVMQVAPGHNGGYLQMNPGRGQQSQPGHRTTLSGYTTHTSTSFVNPTW